MSDPETLGIVTFHAHEALRRAADDDQFGAMSVVGHVLHKLQEEGAWQLAIVLTAYAAGVSPDTNTAMKLELVNARTGETVSNPDAEVPSGIVTAGRMVSAWVTADRTLFNILFRMSWERGCNGDTKHFAELYGTLLDMVINRHQTTVGCTKHDGKHELSVTTSTVYGVS